MISQVIRSALEKNETILYLESSKKDHSESMYSFLAIGVESSFRSEGRNIEIFEDGKVERINDNPWDALDRFRNKYPNKWFFGYLGYDLKNYNEHLKSENPDLIGAPDCFLFEPEVLLKIDVQDGSITSLKGKATIPNDKYDRDSFEIRNTKMEDRGEYQSCIQEAKHLIHEGEFYEINISHQICYDFSGSAFDLYESMKEVGEVPFGAFLSFENLKISCLSPERYLKKEGRKLISQPIKGTIGRNSLDELEIERAQLSASEKDKAENLMIVDLVRNDLSRVAEAGSVQVTSLFDIQSFKTVHQMVSTVEAVVKDDVSEIAVIQHSFPMGSMTGAPKISAMKVIDELENYTRGIYSGAIGYFNPDGDFDFNVVIRTAIQKGDKLFYSVGGAITADSDPEHEWEETLIKARALTEVGKSIS